MKSQSDILRESRQLFRQHLYRKSLHEERMLIDPELATLMLRQNKQNRETKRADIVFLAGEITAGRWTVLADGVGFDSNGILIDGQHRLFAIIEAGRAVEVRVTFGESPEARIAVDVRGKVGDGSLLEAAGQSHGDMRAAVSKIYLIMVKRSERRRFAFEEIEQAAREIAPQLDFLSHHVKTLYRIGVRAPLLAALVVSLQKDDLATRTFVDRLVNIQRSGPNDPVTRFEALTTHVHGRTREDLFHAGLRCLRAFITGAQIERVRTTSDELAFFRDAA